MDCPAASLRKTTTLPWSASRAGNAAESALAPMYTTWAPSMGRTGISKLG